MEDRRAVATNGGCEARRATRQIALVSMWERYSFYNMFALLALFLSASAAQGGLGWSEAGTLRVFGLYVLVVTTGPLVGGLVIERWMSGRHALIVGAGLLFAGHILLALTALLASSGGQLGSGPVSSHAATTGSVKDLVLGASIVLVVAGNGLYNPMLTVVIGRLPHARPTARESAFTIFFTWANIGGLLSVVLGGWLSQRYGWTIAFAAAACGMMASIIALVRAGRCVFPFVHGRDAGIVPAKRALPRSAGNPASIFPVAIMLAIVVVSAALSYQSYGFISLFIANAVDRDINGFIIPPSWVLALNPVTIMVMAPILLRSWSRQGLGYSWSATVRYAAGFLVMSLAFGCLALLIGHVPATGGASILWTAAVVMLLAFTELLTTPVGMSTFTRLAPLGRQALYLGSYGAAVGIGGWLSGAIGARATGGDSASVIAVVALSSALCGTTLILLRHRTARLAI